MSAIGKTELCQQVEEELAQILDGSAAARLFDHLAECDVCRDIRHDADQVAESVRLAGKDFRPADDFVERLAARLDAARPDGAKVASAPREARSEVRSETPPTIDRSQAAVTSSARTEISV